jgi:hypothetical protein
MLDGLRWCAMDVRPADLGDFLQQRRSDVTLTAAPQTATSAQERRLYPDIGLLGVRFISLITVIGPALGSPSACSQAESRSNEMATRDTATRLRSPDHDCCRDCRRSRVSALHCDSLVGWNLTPFG